MRYDTVRRSSASGRLAGGEETCHRVRQPCEHALSIDSSKQRGLDKHLIGGSYAHHSGQSRGTWPLYRPSGSAQMPV